MENNNCFVCLENTKNKVCHICNCYAHPKCFGKYINKNLIIEIITSRLRDNKYFIDAHVHCPICKTISNNNRRITRDATAHGRLIILFHDIGAWLDLVNENNKDNIYEEVYKTILNHKELIYKDKDLYLLVKDRLKEQYYEDNWKNANMYYYQLYGEQI
jgi:hypothetical protein